MMTTSVTGRVWREQESSPMGHNRPWRTISKSMEIRIVLVLPGGNVILVILNASAPDEVEAAFAIFVGAQAGRLSHD
jgi:hypothetical protein